MATSRRWSLSGSVTVGELDSDVDFHDSEWFSVNVGVLYRVGVGG